MKENLISDEIIGAAMEVHRELGGPGLLESIYEEALAYELTLRNIPVARQMSVPVRYKRQALNKPLVLDLLVGEKVIVEIKAVENLNPVTHSQILTYLRLTRMKLGLIINFGNKFLKEGIHRVVNGLPE
ncbi:MAG TPA: GxxExxY protein [Desulfuromonadales bacterium]|nr:GxxExxY protein [Desulfuromonadales bacterium]